MASATDGSSTGGDPVATGVGNPRAIFQNDGALGFPPAIRIASSRCFCLVRNGNLRSSEGLRTHGDLTPSSWRTCAPNVESHSRVSTSTDATPPTGVQ